MQLVVFFSRKSFYVIAQRCNVGFECLRLFLCCFPVGIGIVGVQRHLGIDNHVALVRQMDNHIGLYPVPGGIDIAFLYRIFLAFAQARDFQYTFQNHFSPATLGFVFTLKGIHQIGRFFGKTVVHFHKFTHFVLQGVPVPCPPFRSFPVSSSGIHQAVP